MPGLTVNTSPKSHASPSHDDDHEPRSSRSTSPIQPPYSPITPTLASARLAASAPVPRQPPKQTYTHSQPPPTAISQPPLIPIKFEENTDALALKSAISILQIQAKNAERDMRSLQALKERAAGDPEGFGRALVEGHIKSSGDRLFNPSQSEVDDEEVEEEGEDRMDTDEKTRKESSAWGILPTPQNVVRCPPINWNQYAVVGESLDKLHRDQQMRPTDGAPQQMGPDGQLHSGLDGPSRQSDVRIAAPYQAGKDKIEKMGTRKGGKR